MAPPHAATVKVQGRQSAGSGQGAGEIMTEPIGMTRETQIPCGFIFACHSVLRVQSLKLFF